ncbi:MAG: hypothetical protein EAZ61_11160 [Oscillatoriales cyanobacterium]|jgi:hypothetical protein|nr:MAG: hypothetical protein EAZ61_11160 [Oscillatoriales cyanobacterium]
MSCQSCLVSSCRACRYYSHEGRRGGLCQQLGAPVSSQWKACSLAFPAFAPSWEHLEGLVTLTSPSAIRHESIPSSLEYTPVPVKAETLQAPNSMASIEKILA